MNEIGWPGRPPALIGGGPRAVGPPSNASSDPGPLRHGSRRGGFFLSAELRGGSQPQTGPLPEPPGGLFRTLRARHRHGLPLAVQNISTTVLAMGSFARRTSRDGVVSQMQQQGSSHSGKEQITSQWTRLGNP